MTPRRPFQTQWIHRDEPEPIDAHMKKAQNLPRPGPGIVVPVPLHLLPEYLALYSLVPMTRGEAQDSLKQTNTRRLAGVLYVKRVPKEKP